MSDINIKIDKITNLLRRDDGISNAVDYTEQISWILFLKFINDLEAKRFNEFASSKNDYKFIIRKDLRWDNWAFPKDRNGNLDVEKALTGSDLIDFINKTLFVYLKQFKNDQNKPKSLEFQIGSVFELLNNRVMNGTTLREILDIVSTLNFQNPNELYELSLIYENLLRSMGFDGGNSGEYYTPRAVVKSMVQTLNPQLGETIYDGAIGSAGFLVEAFDFLLSSNEKDNLTDSEWEIIQKNTFFGREKTSIVFIMGMLNMILRGIENPNIYRGDTLVENIFNINSAQKHDVILSNPPFGGKEDFVIQQKFPIQTNATEMLFIQHFMEMLKFDGRAAIIVPEGVLFQKSTAFQKIKKDLLERFNVHTIVSLPSGVFLPYSGVKTNILYFNNGETTSKIWYYEVDPPYKLTKNKPIKYDHLEDFVNLFKNPIKRNHTTKSIEGRNDWTVSISDIVDFDLSAKNPNKIVSFEIKSPSELIEDIVKDDNEVLNLTLEIKKIINKNIFSTSNYIDNEFTITLDELVSFKSVGLSQPREKKFNSIQCKYLKSNNIKYDGSINFSDILEINAKKEEVEKYKLDKGDFLINVRNGNDNIGKTGIFNSDEITLYNSNILRIKFNKNVNPYYIHYQFQSTIIQNQLDQIKSGTSSVVNISYKTLGNVKLLCPPKSEQDRIVENLDLIYLKSNLLNELVSKKSANIKSLMEGLVDIVFQK